VRWRDAAGHSRCGSCDDEAGGSRRSSGAERRSRQVLRVPLACTFEARAIAAQICRFCPLASERSAAIGARAITSWMIRQILSVSVVVEA